MIPADVSASDGEAPWSPMRQLGAITVPRSSPKLTHGAQARTNYPVTALVAAPSVAAIGMTGTPH